MVSQLLLGRNSEMLMEPRDLTEQPGCPFTLHTGSDSCLPCVEKTSQAETLSQSKGPWINIQAWSCYYSKIKLLFLNWICSGEILQLKIQVIPKCTKYLLLLKIKQNNRHSEPGPIHTYLSYLSFSNGLSQFINAQVCLLWDINNHARNDVQHLLGLLGSLICV